MNLEGVKGYALSIIFFIALIVVIEVFSVRVLPFLVVYLGFVGVIVFYVLKVSLYIVGIWVLFKKSHNTIFTISLILLISLAFTGFLVYGISVGSRQVGTYYYTWWWEEWAGYNEIDPVLGDYRINSTIIETHLDWMIDSGIDFVVVSWAQTEVEDERLDLVFEAAEGKKIEVCVLYEFTNVGGNNITLLQERADYIYKNYTPREEYFSFHGKPLFLVYTALENFSDLSNLPKWNDERFTVRYVPVASTYNTAEVEDYPFVNPLFKVQEFFGDIVSIMPGINATVNGSHVYEGRDGGETYRRQWDNAITLSRLNRHKNMAAIICSWNEFSEHTHIEPTEKFGDLYLNITRKKSEEFKSWW